MPTVSQFIVWIVVGVIGGGLAASMITWNRAGFGRWHNLALGLVGALVGGFLFRALGLFPGLDSISISLRDIVAAIVGSLIILAGMWAWEKFGKK